MKKKWYSENWFLIGIVVILIISIWQPIIGRSIKDAGFLTPLTFIVMFLSGLGVSTANIKGGLRDYKSILYGFAGTFFVFPLLTYFILQLFTSTSSELYVGFMILSVQSSTLSSAIILTMTAGGNVPVALIITLINNIISAVISPFLLKIFLPIDNTIIMSDIILKLILVLVVPVILAQLIRYYFDKQVALINPYRKSISKIIILLFILTAASTAEQYLSANLLVVLVILLLVLLVHLLMVLLAFLYSRLVKLPEDSRIAVTFCSAQKTLPASLLIWGNYFSANTLAPLIFVSYHVMQLFVDSILVNFFNKRDQIGKADS